MTTLNIKYKDVKSLRGQFCADLRQLCLMEKSKATANTGLAKVAVQCSADTFVVNQSLVLRINICGGVFSLH